MEGRSKALGRRGGRGEEEPATDNERRGDPRGSPHSVNFLSRTTDRPRGRMGEIVGWFGRGTFGLLGLLTDQLRMSLGFSAMDRCGLLRHRYDRPIAPDATLLRKADNPRLSLGKDHSFPTFTSVRQGTTFRISPPASSITFLISLVASPVR